MRCIFCGLQERSCLLPLLQETAKNSWLTLSPIFKISPNNLVRISWQQCYHFVNTSLNGMSRWQQEKIVTDMNIEHWTRQKKEYRGGKSSQSKCAKKITMKTETNEGTLLSSKKEKFFSNFQGVMCGGVDGCNSLALTSYWGRFLWRGCGDPVVVVGEVGKYRVIILTNSLLPPRPFTTNMKNGQWFKQQFR